MTNLPLPDSEAEAGGKRSIPSLAVENRQRLVPVLLNQLRMELSLALPMCLEKPGSDAPQLLAAIPEVSINIVSPSRMARAHFEFLGLRGATDVITFDYGEIILCAAVAAENADRFQSTPQRELTLYAIHGLLHLNGYDDLTDGAAERMRRRQANILKAVHI